MRQALENPTISGHHTCSPLGQVSWCTRSLTQRSVAMSSSCFIGAQVTVMLWIGLFAAIRQQIEAKVVNKSIERRCALIRPHNDGVESPGSSHGVLHGRSQSCQ